METPSIIVFVPPFDGGDESTAESKNLSILCQTPEYFDGIAGVQIGPGATLFTRTPSAVHARESECVKMLIALWLEEKSSHWSTSFGRKPLLPAVQEPSLSRERFSENSRFHD